MRVLPAVLTVNSLADTDTFDPGSSIFLPPGTRSDRVLTFREAVQIVNRGTDLGYSTSEIAQINLSSPLGTDDVIRFAPSLTASGPATIMMVGAQYDLRGNFVIEGPGAEKLSINANSERRVLTLDGGATVRISGLTLKNGRGKIGSQLGDGGVINSFGTLTLDAVTISGGRSGGNGGGVFNQGTLTLENSTISDSKAGLGGAIANFGTLRVNSSTIENNIADFQGGGIHNSRQGSVTVSNSTLVGNFAGPEFVFDVVNAGQGGGIDNESGAVTVINSTLVGNSVFFRGAITPTGPRAQGGAINNQDRLSLIHCTVTGNSVTADGGGAGVFGKAGATTRMFNSILVDNRVLNSTTLDDVSGQVSSDSFGNLTSQRANPAGLFNGKGNYLIGTSLVLTAPATYLTDLFDPQGLRLNGGLTRTIALQPGSFAIDKGFTTHSPTGVPLTMLDANGAAFDLARNPKDQRGGVIPRAYRQPDLGATEFIPTTLVVDSVADNLLTHVPAVTLREAVELANAMPGDNTITFDPGLEGTIRLTLGELALTDKSGATRILGPGPSRLAIDGNRTSRIFNVAAGVQIFPGAKAEIAGLTIQNGIADFGGGIFAGSNSSLTVSNVTFKNNQAASDGGGVSSIGTLIVGGCTFEDNVAGRSGGGVFALGSGGKLVFNSTFHKNVANGTAVEDLTSTKQEEVNGGGGIAISRSSATIEICTFVGNHAEGVGGGIAVLNPKLASVHIVHNTLTANTVGFVPGHPFDVLARRARSALKGGGLFAQQPEFEHVETGVVNVINTIIVGNVVKEPLAVSVTDYGGPSFGGPFVITRVGVPGRGNGMARTNSVIGGVVSQILTGGLADLGGPTKTIALVNDPSNPALGKADRDTETRTDQRGFVRSGTAPSIGAFEPGSTTLLVTTTTDEDNGTISPNVGTGTSLREAINLANSLSFPTTITFAGLTGVIELTQGTLTLSNRQKITIEGPGADKLTLNGLGRSRILNVKFQAVAEVSGLTFQNGFSLVKGGGAIENIGDLTLKNIVAQSNVVDSNGSSILAQNNGGGAIFNHREGKLAIENSTFLGNHARNSINNNGGGGGAISNDGRLSVVGTTFANNDSDGDEGGGGIANYGSAFVFNTTFTQNVARSTVQGGGAIKNEGNLSLVNSTLTHNFAHAGAGLFTKRLTNAPFATSAAFNTIVSGNLSFADGNGQRTSQNLGGQTPLATRSATNLIDGDVTKLFETAGTGVPRLADNGGPTKTVALKNGSPAINAGTDLDTLFKDNFSTFSQVFPNLTAQLDSLKSTDQRGTGFTRNFAGGTDIGAFELSRATSLKVTAPGPSRSVSTSESLSLEFTVQNTSNIPAENVRFTMALPAGVNRAGGFFDVGGDVVLGQLGFGDGRVTVSPFALPAGGSATITVAFDLKQSAAGKTFSLEPKVTTETFHTEITLPTLSVSVLALPDVPQLSTFTKEEGITQTSVGQQVTYQLTFPTTTSGQQTAKVDPETVSADDFRNTGTAPIRFDSISVTEENNVQTVVVKVIPTASGTLRLALKDLFNIKDNFGRDVTAEITSPSLINVRSEFLVDSNSDVDDNNLSVGKVSLREAIRLANATAGDDTIRFAPNLGSITLTSELQLTDNTGTVAIFGPNGGTQVIQRSRTDANRFRLFQIATGASAAFRSLTLANGSSTGNGGAVLNFGSLDIDLSTLSFNDAGGHGGAIFNGGGTGQTLGLRRSTLSNNTADRGGAIFNDNSRGSSTLTGELNTISGNSSRSHGGGIANVGVLNLAQSTIVLNRANSDGVNGGDGGGLAAFNVETLTGSIIAGNTRGLVTTSANSDIGGGFINTSSNNLVGDGPTGGGIPNGVNGNIVGNNAGGIIPLANILDPTLARNGGPTQTHALIPLSTARDAGAVGTLTTDQRGFDIINAPDIGAFEYQPTRSPIVLSGDTTVFVGPGATVVISEVLTGSGNLIKSGTGTLILRGNNTYSGQTNVNSGTLTAGHHNALGTASGSGGTVVASGASLIIDPGRDVPEALTLSGNGFNNTGALRMNSSFRNLDGSPAMSIWSGTIAVANNTRIDVNSNSQLTIAGKITPGTGPINQGLTKTGDGRLIFGNSNTYTGPTTINAGVLTINGNQTTSSITLNGGTLAGLGTTGTITVSPVVAGLTTASQLSPGDKGTNNGIGKMIARGHVVLNSNATFDVQINGMTAGTQLDNVDVTGTVTLNNATLTGFLGSFVSQVGNEYQIITNDGSDQVVGTFNGLNEGAFLTISDQKFQISYKGGTGNDVVLTHVNTNSAFRDRSITTLVGENGRVTLQGRIVEVDPKDTFKLTIKWGDNRTEVRHFRAGSNGQLVTLTHQYSRGRATPYEVFLKWEDQHGGGNTTRLLVQVANVAPKTKISGPAAFLTGTRKVFRFQATDPADQRKNMRWRIDFGDGSATRSLSGGSNLNLGYTYTRPGIYLIRATATDFDGLTSAIATYRVRVTAPVKPKKK